MRQKRAIQPENGPVAVGPYSPAVRVGDWVFCSGQIPLDPKTGQLVQGSIAEQTRQCLENLKAVLAEVGLELKHVVKTTVFMTDLSQFPAMNEVYAQYFEEPYPARSTVQVGALPKGALVEIEAVALAPV